MLRKNSCLPGLVDRCLQVSDYESMTSLAYNRALSAANLKEYNSEIDAKVSDFAKEINSNKDKNFTTVRNLKKAMIHF